jgi:hypothetical protein
MASNLDMPGLFPNSVFSVLNMFHNGSPFICFHVSLELHLLDLALILALTVGIVSLDKRIVSLEAV